MKATDGETYPARFMRPCGHCGCTPTRVYMNGAACKKHTPAALAEHPEVKPDPELTMEGRRLADGAPAPQQHREARARAEAAR